MTLVRERRQKQPLSLSLPHISPAADTWCQLLSSPPSSISSSSSPGTGSLSEFEKLQVLGHGSGGVVYKVRCRQTGEIYAVKILRCGESGMREVDVVRRVECEFLVECHGINAEVVVGNDCSVPVGDVFLVMEYMREGSVREVLEKRGRLGEGVIGYLARRVLKGLKYLHGMNIVHGDIKPSNLLINSEWEVKIADFGVSRVSDEEFESSSMGTCAYMSPERLDPGRWPEGSSAGFSGDVWAVGVVVMECFLGHFPLLDEGHKPDWASMVCAVSFGGDTMRPPENASPELQGFIMRCLVKDWRSRATVEELLNHPFVTKYCDVWKMN
ncbi:PREDICTED: mitogen-activated protein kinase kinase 10 [Ipomoea nil]|uniref:mitogen-activated protein kinase kinase 10 n=1 Tax=Ipomoea nil TaxID=35883 RepID=UPI000901E498|nr:PREDICTED: mitogen-activated protein kinase kinase 10 [Ipomoea nil]